MVRYVLLAALLVACSKNEDPGPTCEQVMDHVLFVSKQMLVGHEGMNGAGDRKGMIDQCIQRNMSKKLRECLMAAKSLDGLGHCYGRSPQPLRTPVAAPPAPGSGSG